MFSKAYSNDEGIAYLAVADRKPVGIFVGNVWYKRNKKLTRAFSQKNKETEINYLASMTDLKGVGSILLANFLKYSQQQKIKPKSIFVRSEAEDSGEANRFYQSLGFEIANPNPQPCQPHGSPYEWPFENTPEQTNDSPVIHMRCQMKQFAQKISAVEKKYTPKHIKKSSSEPIQNFVDLTA